MKHFLLLVICKILFITWTGAQMKIGPEPGMINSSAMLQIDAGGTRGGILIPRVSLSATSNASPCSAHVAGMLLYNILLPVMLHRDIILMTGQNGSGWPMPEVTGHLPAIPERRRVRTFWERRMRRILCLRPVIRNRPGCWRRVDANNQIFSVTGGDANINGFTVGRGKGNIISNAVAGLQALYSNTTGFGNTAMGYRVLKNNTSGNYNTAFGWSALTLNSTGAWNTAIGTQTLQNNTTGQQNTAIGNGALWSNSTGSSNTSLGYAALFYNTTGGNNVALGNGTLNVNITGDYNTASGVTALSSNTTGFGNVANGYQSLLSSTTGFYNTALGVKSLSFISTGTNNIGIGYDVQGSGPTVSNEVTIGNSANNSYRIYGVWTNISDRSMKHDIRPSTYGLDFVKKLNPSAYVMNNSGNGKQDYGFIAQEVKTVLESYGDRESDLVQTVDVSKGTLGLKYNSFIPILTRAIQEQQKQIEAQQKLLDAQQKQIEEMKTVLGSNSEINRIFIYRSICFMVITGASIALFLRG